jgi:dynein heavy chain, axonemal
MVDRGGFYDRKKLFWKDVESTVTLLCAAPPGGGRNDITPRLTRHFQVLCMPQTSEDQMSTIFNSIVQGFLGSYKFKQDVAHLGKDIVASTIEVYSRCGEELLPTPAKAHYTFNLRDISKVFQGLLMVRPNAVPKADDMARLWVHEVSRVFEDRLINQEDKDWFRTSLVAELLKIKFRVQWEFADWQDIIWANFLKAGADDKPYEESQSYDKLAKIMEDVNDDYNLTYPTQMNLVFFKDCMQHMCRAARVFAQPRGNSMLVGVGGSGRSSCARLCSHLAEMGKYEIALTKGEKVMYYYCGSMY